MTAAGRLTPHAWLKRFAKEHGRTKTSLLVQAVDNDPFNCGTPAHLRDARWCAAAWTELVPAGQTLHIRRFHYRLMTRGLLKPNGFPYYVGTKQERDRDWKALGKGMKYARILGFIPREDVEDKRSRSIDWNGTDAAHWPGSGQLAPQAEIWMNPPTVAEVDPVTFYSPSTCVTGYSHHGGQDESYRLLVIVEKSTMAAFLEPICERMGVAMLAATGTVSHTRTRDMLLASSKPLRVLYVSDHDLQGRKMPRAVARQMQFLAWDDPDECGQVDVALTQVALTAEQVEHYGLPKAPDTDVTELDALEEFHPGELGRLLTEAIEQWRDPDHRRALRAAKDTAVLLVADAYAPHAPRIAEVHQRVADEFEEAAERYRQELTAITVGADMAELTELVEGASADIAGLTLPDRPQAHVRDAAQEWLYRSDRSYLEQQMHWHAR